jgi:hypothetical protein
MTGSDRLRNCYPGHGKVTDKFFRSPVHRKMGQTELLETLTERSQAAQGEVSGLEGRWIIPTKRNEPGTDGPSAYPCGAHSGARWITAAVLTEPVLEMGRVLSHHPAEVQQALPGHHRISGKMRLSRTYSICSPDEQRWWPLSQWLWQKEQVVNECKPSQAPLTEKDPSFPDWKLACPAPRRWRNTFPLSWLFLIKDA